MKKALNILLWVMLAVTVLLLFYAVKAAHPANPAEYDASININMMWAYILFIGAIAAALMNTVVGWFKNPAGVKSALLSLILVVVVIGGSYIIANGHDIQIVDLQNNSYFGAGETVITETSIFVTYVAMAAAMVTAIVTEIWSFFK